MRQITVILFILISLSFAVAAQTALPKAKQTTNGHSHGYVFAAPGGTSGGGGGTLHIGGGGDGVFSNGVGIGAEVGYIAPFEYLGDGLGTFSVNGSYHMKSGKSEKLVPFVTGGYTGFFRGGYANGVNFGGGVNYWFKPRLGLRIEFRDNVFLQEGSAHFLNVRVGLAFR
ncbi:MAG: hypothetical protein JST85_26210 [Acidobacteria bacterium]|nr:hypothetical protein [Acidobacteriota bacterium]